jgi:hypothetical protein
MIVLMHVVCVVIAVIILVAVISVFGVVTATISIIITGVRTILPANLNNIPGFGFWEQYATQTQAVTAQHIQRADCECVITHAAVIAILGFLYVGFPVPTLALLSTAIPMIVLIHGMCVVVAVTGLVAVG